jgi:RNA polymerase sigma-70 factor (ECF subfamily)
MQALLRLPEPFREAVVLRDLEGLTYEEIARVVGTRIGTVRSRIARGRDRLRALLESS